MLLVVVVVVGGVVVPVLMVMVTPVSFSVELDSLVLRSRYPSALRPCQLAQDHRRRGEGLVRTERTIDPSRVCHMDHQVVLYRSSPLFFVSSTVASLLSPW